MANLTRVIDRYHLAEEYLRRPLAAPVPFHILVFLHDMLLFCWHLSDLKRHWPGDTPWCVTYEYPNTRSIPSFPILI